MKFENIGAEEEDDEDREFNAKFRDKDGKVMMDKIWAHLDANPDPNPRSFAEIHAEMMERMKKRAEEERKRDNDQTPSDNAT